MCLFLPKTWDKENGVGGESGNITLSTLPFKECCLPPLKHTENTFLSLAALILSLPSHGYNQASRMWANHHDSGCTYIPEKNVVKELGHWSKTATWYSRSGWLKLFIFHNKGLLILLLLFICLTLQGYWGIFIVSPFLSRHYFLVSKTYHFLNIDENKQFKLIFSLLQTHHTWYHIT